LLTDSSPRERRAAAERVRAWAAERGWKAGPLNGSGLEFDRSLCVAGPRPTAGELAQLREIDGVAAVHWGQEALFRVTDAEVTAPVVHLADARFGKGDTSLIAGPCSVEDVDSMLALAQVLKRSGATAFRAGAYKPRTSTYQFQGQGQAGLEILAEVHAQTGLAVVTEVLEAAAVEQVAAVAQILQIGSRNMSNTSLLRAAGSVGLPVLLKRGMSATISEFLQAAEYLADSGCSRILLCERGLRHFDKETRNLLDLSSVPLLKTRTHLPVLVDPSHGVGRADLVQPMMLAAAAAGADGLLVEVHNDPQNSVSDAAQALSPQQFAETASTLRKLLASLDRRLTTAPDAEFSTPLC